MRFAGYNAEKKDKQHSEIYFKAIIFGLLLALAFIGGGIGLKFMIKYIIKYWIWVIVLMFAILFLKRFISKGLNPKKKDNNIRDPQIPEDYN